MLYYPCNTFTYSYSDGRGCDARCHQLPHYFHAQPHSAPREQLLGVIWNLASCPRGQVDMQRASGFVQLAAPRTRLHPEPHYFLIHPNTLTSNVQNPPASAKIDLMVSVWFDLSSWPVFEKICQMCPPPPLFQEECSTEIPDVIQKFMTGSQNWRCTQIFI